MDGYSEAEILRARSQAVRMGIIETPEDSEEHGRRAGRRLFRGALEPNTVAL
jgi:hypothetical protein